MMKHTLSWLLLLGLISGLTTFDHTLLAQDAPAPTSPRKWLVTTYQKLAKAAREHPLTAEEHMWEATADCVPTGPIELRSRVKSLRWNRGVMTVEIEPPVGWMTPPSKKLRPVGFVSRYQLKVSEDEADKMRRGTWFISRGAYEMFRYDLPFVRVPKSHRVGMTMNFEGHRRIYFAAPDLTIEVDGKLYEFAD